MSEPKSQPTTAGDSSSHGLANDATALDALKEILLGDQKSELEKIRTEVDDAKLDGEALGHLLPAAVRSAADRDEKLSKSLAPMIGSALQNSIKKDPQSIVRAISPIMGPAIRDSIRQALQGMVQSLNKTLEYGVSVKGLKWRWEAFTTGKPFAEVVLLHTLLYRVGQVFLIDRETGLLIQHVTLDDNVRDVDLASGMLTAIQDFVRDSFGARDDESLKTMAVGNQTIWIETGADAFLAAVIEGEAPSLVWVTLRECLETIHVDYAAQLAAFSGDSEPFRSTVPILSECLLSAFESDKPKPAKKIQRSPSRLRGWLWTIAGFVGLAALLFVLAHVRAQRRLREIHRLLAIPSSAAAKLEDRVLTIEGSARRRWIDEVQSVAPRLPDVDRLDLGQLRDEDAAWHTYLARLNNEPSVIVTRTNSAEGVYTIEGLFDPMGVHPQDLLVEFDLAAETVSSKWTPFASLLTEPLAQRLSDSIIGPEGVTADVAGNVIRLRGAAPTEWVVKVRAMVEKLGQGKVKLDIQDFETLDLAGLEQLVASIEDQVVYHDRESTRLEPPGTETIESTARLLVRLFETSRRMRHPVQVIIVGHAAADEGNSIAAIQQLAQSRARSIWQLLVEQAVPKDNLVIQGKLDVAKQNPTTMRTTINVEKAGRCSIFKIRAMN